MILQLEIEGVMSARRRGGCGPAGGIVSERRNSGGSRGEVTRHLSAR